MLYRKPRGAIASLPRKRFHSYVFALAAPDQRWGRQPARAAHGIGVGQGTAGEEGEGLQTEGEKTGQEKRSDREYTQAWWVWERTLWCMPPFCLSSLETWTPSDSFQVCRPHALTAPLSLSIPALLGTLGNSAGRQDCLVQPGAQAAERGGLIWTDSV